ncbi:MAG: antitoxin VbhA family protein [Pseudomonadales bacterium]|nr:antitoxin VbhA family protein [Pseudomonadales bacterium]
MKEVSMTIRVEPDLRASFSAAAELEHRPAAQVLREFMRNYVERVGQRVPVPQSLNHAISTAERLRREKAFAYARASVELEGFKLSAADEKHAQRFINGEIDLPEFVRIRDTVSEKPLSSNERNALEARYTCQRLVELSLHETI